MARELMPKSGIMMPYVVVTRDAAVVGVSTVDGRAGALDLVSMGYAKAADYYKKTETYTKTEVDNLITPIMQRALFKDDPFINNDVALRSGGGNGIVSVDMIKVDPNNNIIVGDYDAGVQGVHIYSEGKVDVVYKDSNGQEKSAPLYSDRFRPPVADLPFAAIGQYVTDPTTGRTIGVNRTGENSDLKTLNALTNIKTTKVVFEQSPTVPDAAQPYDAVNLRQLQAAGGGGGASMNGVMNNYIGAVEWFNGSRAKLPAGYIAADGDAISKVTYPDLWAAVKNGFLNSVTEVLWQNNGTSSPYGNRGKYSVGSQGIGDDVGLFRAPDLNGMQSGSLPHIFLSSLGKGSPESAGFVNNSSAPQIIGNGDNVLFWGKGSGTGGAFRAVGVSQNILVGAGDPESGTIGGGVLSLDASRSSSVYSRTDNEIVPNSAYGIWIIRASGAFQAANTNFSVINGDSTGPSLGTPVSGGKIESHYKLANKDMYRTRLYSEGLYGQQHWTTLAVENINPSDGTTVTNPNDAYYKFDSNGTFTAGKLAVRDVATTKTNLGLNLFQQQSTQTWVQSPASSVRLYLDNGAGGIYNSSTSTYATFIAGNFAATELASANFSSSFSSKVAGGSHETWGSRPHALHVEATGVQIETGVFKITVPSVGYVGSMGGVFWSDGSSEWNLYAGSANYKFRSSGVASATSWMSTSDRRLKSNILEIDNSLTKLGKLKGYTYDKKVDLDKEDFVHEAGLIAQEVREVLPEAVGENPQTGLLSLNPAAVLALAINAINELKAEVDDLKSQLASK